MGANLKEVRIRIKSVMSTQQITKAMKMVSASKLRRAQQAITQFRPYANKMNEMLSNILAGSSDTNVSYGVVREVKNVCIVVVTSNKGLCGAFNTNVNKAAAEIVTTKYAEQLAAGCVTFLCIGKKGAEYMARRFKNATIDTESMSLFSELTFDNTAVIGDKLMAAFREGKYDAIEVAYGQFKNAAMQNFIAEPFLPVAKMETTATKTTAVDFEFEPSKKDLLETMVPSILKMQLFKCCLDTHASEHGARMTAMDKATENANDLLKELRINYNKARQEAITKELSEIVGGAIALEG